MIALCTRRRVRRDRASQAAERCRAGAGQASRRVRHVREEGREARGPVRVRCERERGMKLVELRKAVVRHSLGRVPAHSHKLVASVAALVREARDVNLGLGHCPRNTGRTTEGARQPPPASGRSLAGRKYLVNCAASQIVLLRSVSLTHAGLSVRLRPGLRAARAASTHHMHIFIHTCPRF